MRLKTKGLSALAAIALLASGTAAAQLNEGTDGNGFTSVFISVVERDDTNNIVRNLIVDTGITALEAFEGTPFQTTAAQSADILAFLNSSTGTVLFNVGGALTDQTFATDRQGFLTTGFTEGPAEGEFAALGTGIINIQTLIADANFGTFNANGVLQANGVSDKGWHGRAWGNSVGGAIDPSNEVLFGESSQIQAWRWDGVSNAIPNSVLGPIFSNAATGQIGVVPVPAAVWMFGSALALLGWMRRRLAA